jgi:carboxyl-terminal processing protease
MTEDGTGGPRDPDQAPRALTTEPEVAPLTRGRSVLPGGMLIGLLLAGAVFAAGYSLGDRGMGSPDAGGGAAIAEAYDRITRDYVGDVDPDALVGAAIEAMFESLGDPYSSYMGAERFDEDLADVSGEFEGIGARMASEDAAGAACEPLGGACRLFVVDVLTDSPAAGAGLAAGDVVQAIDAKPVAGLTISDAVELVRGPRGTEVRLAIDRDGTGLDLPITRQLIRAQDVRSEVLADGRVGYLRVDTFSIGASDDFHAQLQAHIDAGIEDLVIDLRDDPGGYVDAAVVMASEFLAQGTVYQEEQGDGDVRVVPARGSGIATHPDIGVAVLIDGGTASASEMLAGALGVRDRATLVGTRTFGKGTIQEWTELPGDNGGFRLSIARWLLPDGTSVDGVGVPPDLEVANAPRTTSLEADPVVAAAVEALLAGDAAGPPPSPSVTPTT